jgi:hypothetical protein
MMTFKSSMAQAPVSSTQQGQGFLFWNLFQSDDDFKKVLFILLQ